jgi:hypothetical protein
MGFERSQQALLACRPEAGRFQQSVTVHIRIAGNTAKADWRQNGDLKLALADI